MTRISVVTAVYNRAGTMEDALNSVASQSYPDIEHVIQDGGSTDGTLQLIDAKMRANISLASEPDSGLYDAINKGIQRATGDVIGLMHSDDFFADPRVLERVAQAFQDPAIHGVYGDLDYVAEEAPHRIIRKWRSGPYRKRALRRGWMPPHPTLYLRRDVFERWGLYDTSYRIAADYEAMLRYMTKGNVHLAYVPEVFVKMRVGGESNRSLSNIIEKSREDYLAIRTHNVGGAGCLMWKNLSKLRQFL